MKRKLIFFTGVLALIWLLGGCSIKVEKIIAEDVPALKVGDTYQIKYTVEPENTADPTVRFSTSNEKIAGVDTKGIITAFAPGSVEISILPNDEERNDPGDTKTGTKISVTITQPVKTVKCKPELTVAVGKSVKMDAAVSPENASDKKLVYKSSDESVVTVDDTGKIAGLKKGAAVVTAASANGVHAECKVTVKQPVTGLKLDKKSLELEVAGTASIKAVLSPKGANMNTKVTFSSSDKNVATVDAKGIITAISEGQATISAAVLDVNGKKITAKCDVTVYVPYVPEPEPVYNEPDNSGSGYEEPDDSSDDKLVPIQPFVPYEPSFCTVCGGTGIMLSGVTCYFCDGTGKNPDLNR